MPYYRRTKRPGATYFFTVVTARRRPLFADPAAISLLRHSIAEVKRELPFSILAWVVLPDHMHAIWTLPPGDADFSRRWGRIKAGFSRRYGGVHTSAPGRNSGLWQPRFWEHLIRDEKDLATHVDYTHYNPVKHGLVQRVAEWPYSSFHRHVQQGMLPVDWGDDGNTDAKAMKFGE